MSKASANPILEYRTPVKPPRRFRITNGLKADIFALIRGAFFALFLICLCGASVLGYGPRWQEFKWTSSGRFTWLQIDDCYYGPDTSTDWRVRFGSPRFYDKDESILATNCINGPFGVQIGRWPYASWFSLYLGPPLLYATILLVLVWRLTRIKKPT